MFSYHYVINTFWAYIQNERFKSMNFSAQILRREFIFFDIVID